MDGKLRGIQGASSAVSYVCRKFEYENQNRASSQVYGVQKQAYQKRTGLSAPRSLGLRMNCEEPYSYRRVSVSGSAVKSGEEL